MKLNHLLIAAICIWSLMASFHNYQYSLGYLRYTRQTHTTYPTVAICIETQHSAQDWNSVENTPIQTSLIPSLERTIVGPNLFEYNFRLYLAAQDDDDFWHQHQHHIKTPTWLSVLVKFYKPSQHKIPFNSLMKDAYNDGVDYLVRVSEDSTFETINWVAHAIDTLESYDPPNVGMVGTKSLQANKVITV